ncbi:MAG: hypothetical protein LBN29_06815 [Mediterranea sp.]|jgi:hypothetical protein|nr:hypothetical protein [Mediterranea sp.]
MKRKKKRNDAVREGKHRQGKAPGAKENETISFFKSNYQYTSTQKRFGLCDDSPPPHKPAYLDEKDGYKWIATVVNDMQLSVTFVALDNSNIVLRRSDGKIDRCSDGMLVYDVSAIAFVELTTAMNKNWRNDKYGQLRTTIEHFERTEDAGRFVIKKAFIANSSQPKAPSSHLIKMERFMEETGYVLEIKHIIEVS